MSHDLRTPLAGMRAMVESLEDGIVADPETVGPLSPPAEGRDRPASRRWSTTCSSCRGSRGRCSFDLERVAADDLVEEALASAEPVARAKGVRLVGETQTDLPVEVDPDEFGRVLRNLLLNAIRHTPSEAPSP